MVVQKITFKGHSHLFSLLNVRKNYGRNKDTVTNFIKSSENNHACLQKSRFRRYKDLTL
jgi:hypothetical protein